MELQITTSLRHEDGRWGATLLYLLTPNVFFGTTAQLAIRIVARLAARLAATARSVHAKIAGSPDNPGSFTCT